jgi:hypothetical protein
MRIRIFSIFSARVHGDCTTSALGVPSAWPMNNDDAPDGEAAMA